MTLRYKPFADSKRLRKLEKRLVREEHQNVGKFERILSGALGIILFVQGISGRSIPGLIIGLAGGALIYRGITGHCSVYERMEETHETHSEPVDGDWNSSGLEVVRELSRTA